MAHENREFIIRSIREALLAGALVAVSVFVEKVLARCEGALAERKNPEEKRRSWAEKNK
jgi:tmRNA-binding protein